MYNCHFAVQQKLNTTLNTNLKLNTNQLYFNKIFLKDLKKSHLQRDAGEGARDTELHRQKAAELHQRRREYTQFFKLLMW